MPTARDWNALTDALERISSLRSGHLLTHINSAQGAVLGVDQAALMGAIKRGVRSVAGGSGSVVDVELSTEEFWTYTGSGSTREAAHTAADASTSPTKLTDPDTWSASGPGTSATGEWWGVFIGRSGTTRTVARSWMKNDYSIMSNYIGHFPYYGCAIIGDEFKIVGDSSIYDQHQKHFIRSNGIQADPSSGQDLIDNATTTAWDQSAPYMGWQYVLARALTLPYQSADDFIRPTVVSKGDMFPSSPGDYDLDDGDWVGYGWKNPRVLLPNCYVSSAASSTS